MRRLCLNSGFNLVYSEIALRQLKKMDKQVSKRITTWISDRLVNCKNPRLWGKALQGSILGENWCYRVGDYRILCNIEDENILVIIAGIGARKEVYRL